MVTNQPGIAKNICTLQELHEIHVHLIHLLNTGNAYLNAIYFCPHHPDKGFPEEIVEFKCKCLCRKPEIGLLKEAQKDYGINLNKCFIIGDTTTDIQAGVNAGCKTILVKTGYAGMDKKCSSSPDYVFDHLFEAINFVIKYNFTCDET